MSVIFGMVIIAQVTKIFKVGFEVMDAFDLFSVVTSLKMFEKLKGWRFLAVRVSWSCMRMERKEEKEEESEWKQRKSQN